MLKTLRFSVIAAVLVACLASAVTAAAAPVGWERIDVTIHSDQQQALLLVSGELPENAKLPYEGELAVPAGMKVEWVGEILGGRPEDDVTLQYKTTTAEGRDVYKFTLTKARIVQIEGTLPNVISFDGTNYITGLTWTAWQAVPELRVSQRIPQSASILTTSPGAEVQAGDAGFSYYTKTVKDVKAGDTVDLAFSYTLPAAGTAAGAPAGTAAAGSDSLVIGIILLLFAAGFVVVLMNVNKKMAAKAALAAPEDFETPATATFEDNAEETPAQSAHDLSEPELEDEPDDVVPVEKRKNSLVLVVAVVAVFVAGFVIAGNKGTSATAIDGKFTRSFGSQSACQAASMPITANQGVDLQAEAETLLKAFEGMEGVGDITIDVAQSKIDMAWCESSQSEESMRQALMATGLVTLGQSTAIPVGAPVTTTTAQ